MRIDHERIRDGSDDLVLLAKRCVMPVPAELRLLPEGQRYVNMAVLDHQPGVFSTSPVFPDVMSYRTVHIKIVPLTWDSQRDGRLRCIDGCYGWEPEQRILFIAGNPIVSDWEREDELDCWKPVCPGVEVSP